MKDIHITILGGSDHKPGPLPARENHLHSIGTYKGADISIGGKRLVERLVDSLTKSEGFGPISIAGPGEVYEPLGLDCTIVDTDGSVSENLQAAINHHNREFGSDTSLALVAYDIVLDPSEISQLRVQFEEGPPSALWVPFVRKPRDTSDMGAFEWKPSYEVRLEKGSDLIGILPGHLAIFTPKAVDLPFLYRVLDLAYQSRNQSISDRRRTIVSNILLFLLRYDLGMIRSLRIPRYTATILSNGLRLARKLKKRQLVLSELEKMIGAMFLRPEFVEKGVRHPLVEILGLAEDVDTEEEARGIEDMYLSAEDTPPKDD